MEAPSLSGLPGVDFEAFGSETGRFAASLNHAAPLLRLRVVSLKMHHA